MRLIDADHLNEKMIPNCPIEEGGIPLPDFATHIKILEMYPTVDAVEVVRCKYCKHWVNGKSCAYCNRLGGMMCDTVENDFCSYGERKDNETE